MPHTSKQQQSQQKNQHQVLQHPTHKKTATSTIVNHQHHAQQVHLASNSTAQNQQYQITLQQQVQPGQQQQVHVIQVPGKLLEQPQEQIPTVETATNNIMISSTGEVIPQQQIFKIVSTDATTGNVIIDTSPGNQSLNAATTSKVLLSNLTVLSKQQSSTGNVTGQQSTMHSAQTINFVNAKHVYTTTSAASSAPASTLYKQQKFSVTAPSLGGSFKNTALKQSATHSQQYLQQISGGLGGHQKTLPTGNRNTHIFTNAGKVSTVSGTTNTVGHCGALSAPPNTAQTMVLQQPHKFLTTSSTSTKSTLSTGGNFIKKTPNTLRMSNNISNTTKLMNNFHPSQGVKTFITQNTSSIQSQHQQASQNVVHAQQFGCPQQQHQPYVKGGSKSKLVKHYSNAIINSSGTVTIATLPPQQLNQNILNSGSQAQHQQHIQTGQSQYANHYHKATATAITGGAGSTPKVNKLNSKYCTANVVAQLPPGTQLHQKTVLNQETLQAQQFQTFKTNNSHGNIKFVNAQGSLIQQQQSLASQKLQGKQQHLPQYQSIQQHFEDVDSDNGSNSNLYTTQPLQHRQPASAVVGSNSSTAVPNSILSDEIMMVNGTQMTDELSARILQSMSQKSFSNQRYHQQHLVSKSSAITMIPSSTMTTTTPTTTNSTSGHFQNSSNSPSSILLSPRDCIVYPPVLGSNLQQQSPSPHSVPSDHNPSQSSSNSLNNNSASAATGSLGVTIKNYMTAANSNMSTITPHSGLVSNSAINNGMLLHSTSRQVQSMPSSRSQSMERKMHETSISRKSSELYKVNSNNNVLRASFSNIPVTAQVVHTVAGRLSTSPTQTSSVPGTNLVSAQTSTTPLPAKSLALTSQVADSQTQLIHLQSTKAYDANKSGNVNDDIIGEEIRPVPVDTNDIRLKILHAVLLDHTYANPMPSVLPTTFTVHIPPLAGSGTAPTAGNQNWSLGGIGAVAPATSPMAKSGSAFGVASTTTANYSMYSSQFSHIQQDEDSYPALNCNSRLPIGGDIDPGEETETAPEAEAEDDSVTRCICDLTHDDGYMICCDKCCAWQHVDCMGIDRQNIPDEYLCELCQPRPVDKARARALQIQKRKEQNQLILAQAQVAAAAGTVGAAGSACGNGVHVGGLSTLLPNDILSSQPRLVSGVCGIGVSGDTSSVQYLGTGSNLKKGSKILKKIKDSGPGKKTKKIDKITLSGSGMTGKTARKESKKSTKRKKTSHDGSCSAGMTVAEKHAANLRQWIENYELAVTNHYSPELRARLHAITKQASLLQSILNTENPALKELSLGNIENRASTVPHAGGKILISNLDIRPNSPICELRGKYMLTTQYKTQNTSMNMNTPPPNNYHVASYKAHKTPGPFIFFYQLQGVEAMGTSNPQDGGSQTTTTTTLSSDGTLITTTTTLPAQLSPPPTYLKGPEICVDTRTYGNEARFVRRSCRPNAEIQHLFEKGTIHLFIVALTDIRASTEITIRHEPHDIAAVETKKSNVMIIQPTSTQCACGLIKDCIFGAPIPQLPPAAKSNAGRKSHALNGSTSSAGNLTTKLRKANQQNINRHRSTSSSGDSNTGTVGAATTMTPTSLAATVKFGLSSTNILHLATKQNKSPVITTSSSLGQLPMTATSNSNASSGSSSCNLTSIIHDSGICTSSSSPSVSIPSPTQNMHSPIQQIIQQQHQNQQQQQYLRAAQILPQQQQQPLIQSLPTSLMLVTDIQHQQQVLTQSPQATVTETQSEQQQLAEQQSLSDLNESHAKLNCQLEKNETQREKITSVAILPISAQQDRKMMSPRQSQQDPSPAKISSVLEASKENLTEVSMLQPVNASEEADNITNPSTEVLQQFKDVLKDSNDSAPESIPIILDNQPSSELLATTTVLGLSHCSPSNASTSPHELKSPQKSNQTSAHYSNSVYTGRKTPTKNLRTTSFSEDNENNPSEDSSISNKPTSSTPKEKPKLSREDRKMEAILRAIEKMERSQQRKHDQKQTKKQTSNSHNTTPTSPNKIFDSNESLTGACTTNKRSTSHPASGSSKSKKKRKAGNKAASNNNLRKRRQSRINSQESIDGGALENDTVTSESDGCVATHSPPIQAVAKQIHAIESTQCKNMSNNITNNVDQAAGLLMAFANPLQTVPSETVVESSLQSPKRITHYPITSSSPNESTSSPPLTPPSQLSSACLLIEAAVGPMESNIEANSGEKNGSEFKYPLQAKTKKHLMNNWLHQEEETSDLQNLGLRQTTATSPHLISSGLTGGLDSLVKAAMCDFKQSQSEEQQPQNLSMVAQRVEEFIHLTEGSSPTSEANKDSFECERPEHNLYVISAQTAVDLSVRNNSVSIVNSTPNAKNFHLPLQVSTSSNNSSVKKRWLRQAISEESHEESYGLYSTSPSPVTTPLTMLQSFSNQSQMQTVVSNSLACTSSSGMTHSTANGFTTPLKKRRLLLADKDDGFEENMGHFSADSVMNTPFSSVQQKLSQDTTTSEKLKVKPLYVERSKMPKELEEIRVEKRVLAEEQQTLLPVTKICHNVNEIALGPKEEEANDVQMKPKSSDQLLSNNVKRKGEGIYAVACASTNSASTEFNDQEDDVDILRSPSPGQEMIKAEDNLVKIEPEDTSGNNDVKIDVEREESIAADDVMVPQMKLEYKEESVIIQPPSKNVLDVKKENKNKEFDVKEETHGNELNKPKDEGAIKREEHDPVKNLPNIKKNITGQKLKRLRIDKEYSKSDEKLDVKREEINDNAKTKSESKHSSQNEHKHSDSLKFELNLDESGALSLPSNGSHKTCVTNDTFSRMDSISPPLTSVPLTTVTSSSSCQPALLQKNKTLSDDDIQARLHNFHKENILFLQSRNKKSKSSIPNLTSTNNTVADNTQQNKGTPSASHLYHERKDRSEKGKHKSTSSSSVPSKKSKPHKRERTSSSSSSGIKNSNSSTPTMETNPVTLPNSSSSGCSIFNSVLKKPKPLKNTLSSSSTSSTNSNTSYNLVTHQPSIAVKEKHRRQRTASVCSSLAMLNSSTSVGSTTLNANTFSASKKRRQLSFELELTKDMHFINILTGNSTKHKRFVDDGQSQASTKKSKKEPYYSSAKEENKNAYIKMQKTTAASSHLEHKEKKSLQSCITLGKHKEILVHACSKNTTATPSEEINSKQSVATSSKSISTLVKEHSTLPHFNNVILTPSSSDMLPTASTDTILSTGAISPTAQAHPLSPHVENIPIHVKKSLNLISSPPQSAPAQSEISLPSSKSSMSSLPFYNTIYGKLLDIHAPIMASSIPTPSTPSSGSNSSVSIAASSSSGSLSEYLDTKVKSYNSLGGYVSHSALFGLNSIHGKDSVVLTSKASTNELPTPQTPPVTSANTSLTLSLNGSVTPCASPNISTIKILTKTASHDPRLNPQLSAPEPPRQPKRKLSIYEYRKRMRQSQSHESNINSLGFTPITPLTLGEMSNAARVVHPVTDKCTLNSPDRLAQTVDSQIQKEILSSSAPNVLDSLNSSNSSVSNSSLNDSRLKSSSLMEEDSTKGQFNAAPTLLEKQQENICARLKSLKEKQGLTTALGDGNRSRFSTFKCVGNREFGARKKDGDDFDKKKRFISIASSVSGGDFLDNCLEEISSTSTSMSSSREPSPDNCIGKSQFSQYNQQNNYHNKHLGKSSATSSIAMSGPISGRSSIKKRQLHLLNNSDKQMLTSSSDFERKMSLDII